MIYSKWPILYSLCIAMKELPRKKTPNLQKTKSISIEKGLSKKQQLCMQELCQKLRDAGFSCHLVGGAVRDLLRQREVKDLDFTSNARPEEIQSIFPTSIPTGIKHGTITVRLRGESFEVTSYRSEGKYTDARHPDEIRYTSSLSEDLSRRDFSINALAYDPLENELIDEHGGLLDLEQKSIRAIGKAEERFYEDGLRPVRACRFSASLDFSIESETYLALCSPKIHERASQVAIERFSEELLKGFAAKKLSRMIGALEKSALLSIFVHLEQGKANTSSETLELLDQIYPAPPILRMAHWRYALGFHSSKLLQEWAKHLRLSRKQARDLNFYCRYFSFQKELSEYEKNLKKSRPEQDHELLYFVRKFLSQIKEVYQKEGSNFIQCIHKSSQICFESNFALDKILYIYERAPLVIGDLEIGGQDLIALGHRGTRVGKILHQALEQVLREPEKNQKEKLLKELEEYE